MKCAIVLTLTVLVPLLFAQNIRAVRQERAAKSNAQAASGVAHATPRVPREQKEARVGLEVGAGRRQALPTSSLDFAPAVAYGTAGPQTRTLAAADVNGDG